MLKNHITEKQFMTNLRNVRLFFCDLLLTIGVAFTRGENRAVDTFTELSDSIVTGSRPVVYNDRHFT